MAERFVRNSLLVAFVFVLITVLVYTKMEFAEPVTEYVSFVVSTDISIEPILKRVDFTEKLPIWNLDSWLKGWAEVTSGW